MTQRPLGTCFERTPQVIHNVDEPVDRSEVLRYLGYPADKEPNRRLLDVVDFWVDEASRRASPWAIYRILPVADISQRRLRLKTPVNVTEIHGAIGEFLGAAQYVAAFVATAGPELEHWASELMRQDQDLPAMVVNAVGAERAEAAEAAVIGQLRQQASPFDLALTLPYSPGYCGIALKEQKKLFALFGQDNQRVTLTADCLMRPLKSVSGLVGLGAADKIDASGSPCDRCELYSCAMRR